MQITSKEQSRLLNAMRMPATLMVVASHCIVSRSMVSVCCTGGYAPPMHSLFVLMENFCMTLGALSVALFSVISGYYLFAKLDRWTLKHYRATLKKRFQSLLIPYILWNLIAIVALWGKNYIGIKLGLGFAYNEIESSMLSSSSLWEMIMAPIDTPLWYIRELIYLVIASPLIYVLLKNKYFGGSVVALLYILPGLALLLGISFPVNNIQVHFVLGAYLALHRHNILSLAVKLRYGLYPFLLFYLITASLGYRSVLAPVEFLCNTLVSLGLMCVLKDFSGRMKPIVSWFEANSSATFFIYATHTILYINLVRGGLYALLPLDGDLLKVVALLLTIPIVSCATLLTYRMMAKYTPSALAVLSGGRG